MRLPEFFAITVLEISENINMKEKYEEVYITPANVELKKFSDIRIDEWGNIIDSEYSDSE